MNDLRCQLISDFDELQEHAPSWQALLERSADGGPMLTPTWLLTWWRIYGEGNQLAVGLFQDGDRLVGMAPMQRRRCWHRPCLPFRRLEILGADVDEEDGVCSEYLNVVAEKGLEERIARAFAAAVRTGQFGSWDEVRLSSLPGDSVMTSALGDAFRTCGYLVRCEQMPAAPHIPLPVSWEHYVKALPRKSRYAVNHAQKDFDEWAAGQASWHCARSPVELDTGKGILIKLHSERWQGSGEAGAFRPRFMEFHDAVMPQLLARGALDLQWLTVRDEPVAAVYNIVWNNKVYGYQSGRRVDLPQNIRPGTVLLAHAIRHAIDSGRREYDFLGGDALYKKQLALASRPLVRLRVGRCTPLEGLHRLAESAIGGLRAARNAGRSAVGWVKNKSRSTAEDQR